MSDSGSTPIEEVSDAMLSVLLYGADPNALPPGAAELMHEAARRIQRPTDAGEGNRRLTDHGRAAFIDGALWAARQFPDDAPFSLDDLNKASVAHFMGADDGER